MAVTFSYNSFVYGKIRATIGREDHVWIDSRMNCIRYRAGTWTNTDSEAPVYYSDSKEVLSYLLDKIQYFKYYDPTDGPMFNHTIEFLVDSVNWELENKEKESKERKSKERETKERETKEIYNKGLGTRKLCPMKFGSLIEFASSWCEERECAWWSVSSKTCAPLGIEVELNYQLSTLKNVIEEELQSR